MSDDSGFVISGRDNIEMTGLIIWRAALRLEINSKSGMVASRAVNAKTIIPRLVAMGITDVQSPFTAKRKRKAFADLDAYIVGKGGPSRPLDKQE